MIIKNKNYIVGGLHKEINPSPIMYEDGKENKKNRE